MVPDIKNVLFATDLSENARYAFHYAVSFATRFGAHLSLIHVVEKTPDSANVLLKNTFGEEQWQRTQDQHQQDARETLIAKRADYDALQREIIRLCAADGGQCTESSSEDVSLSVTQGHVAEQILAAARKNQCDLIVLGAHRGLLGQTSAGSVAKALLHSSRVPVMVVPPPPA